MKWSVSDEYVREVDLGITWDPNAPDPCLIQTDHESYLIVNLLEDDSQARPVGALYSQMAGVMEWKGWRASLLGPPNDEAQPGHRLWNHGLSSVVWAGEVVRSRWIHDLEVANSVHPRHDPTAYKDLRHFILLLKDSTFECIARDFTVERLHGSVTEGIAAVTRRLRK